MFVSKYKITIPAAHADTVDGDDMFNRNKSYLPAGKGMTELAALIASKYQKPGEEKIVARLFQRLDERSAEITTVWKTEDDYNEYQAEELVQFIISTLTAAGFSYDIKTDTI